MQNYLLNNKERILPVFTWGVSASTDFFILIFRQTKWRMPHKPFLPHLCIWGNKNASFAWFLCMSSWRDFYKCQVLNRGGRGTHLSLSNISKRLMNIIFTNWNICISKQSFESRYVGGVILSAKSFMYNLPTYSFSVYHLFGGG